MLIQAVSFACWFFFKILKKLSDFTYHCKKRGFSWGWRAVFWSSKYKIHLSPVLYALLPGNVPNFLFSGCVVYSLNWPHRVLTKQKKSQNLFHSNSCKCRLCQSLLSRRLRLSSCYSSAHWIDENLQLSWGSRDKSLPFQPPEKHFLLCEFLSCLSFVKKIVGQGKWNYLYCWKSFAYEVCIKRTVWQNRSSFLWLPRSWRLKLYPFHGLNLDTASSSRCGLASKQMILIISSWKFTFNLNMRQKLKLLGSKMFWPLLI